MKTLADTNLSPKAKTRAEKRLARIKKILGRDNQLPANLSSEDILNCGLSEPEEVLKKAGYLNIKRGWIFKINKQSRYHAFFSTDEFGYKYIHLHKDIVQNGKHKAIRDVLDEKIRLKQFIIPRINTGKNNVFLPREERLKALELLTNSPQS